MMTKGLPPNRYTPALYDPYNNISFVELNKARRRELERPIEDRVYNRDYKPRTLKIFIRRNGDLHAKPKPFIWRLWQSARLEDLVDEIASHLDMNGSDATLYDSRGRPIGDPDEIYEGGTFVLGLHEPFDGQVIEAVSNVPAPRGFNDPYLDQQQQHYVRSLNSTYVVPKKAKRPKKQILPTHHPRPESSFTHDDRTEIYSVNHGDYDPPNIASSDFGNYQMYRSHEDDYNMPQASYDYEETPWADLDELRIKDIEMLSKHRQKFGFRRSRSAVIYNRKDQTNPDAYIIYAFLNGQGLECQYINFNRKQLEKGLDFLLELVAKRFSVKPSKLVNMDGIRIRDVTELMSRGAYVLIPVGQSFRDTWYFLPDNAIDTSMDVERVRARSAQRDRYIQRQEQKLVKQTKMRRTVADKRDRHRSAGTAPLTTASAYRNQSVGAYPLRR